VRSHAVCCCRLSLKRSAPPSVSANRPCLAGMFIPEGSHYFPCSALPLHCNAALPCACCSPGAASHGCFPACLPCTNPAPAAAQVVEKLVQELTLLGFVSLLLTTVSGPASSMCSESSGH